ncbi:uncharacterized protein I206_102303 [Kwoniella pini CBS 10737]|uniref:Rubredoxin-like domain-containing protein n=1 Tax=Kwoniella pini CBS 10737 TaxID=1296096 RepID=A0A1B9HT40_9TREE|nr:uncharacterized protein I206_07673 [Kwoniella pini CBS 10737]OCF46439.1 hypothetical protein I206_07673 [Kwoniella pini CBS 10737]
MPHCSRCLKIEMTAYELEQSENGDWACPFCGLVDSTFTARSQLKDFAKDAGSVMDENTRLQIKNQQDRLQRKFQEEVDTIFNLYLGISSLHTSILGYPAPNLKHGAKQWFERMREAEKKYKPNRIHLLQRSEARRTRYLVVVSIKLAAQESALTVLHNRLASAGVTLRNKRNLPGYTKGDENIDFPELQAVFHRANAFSGSSFGHLDSDIYLRHLFTRYSRWVNFVLTPLEITLLHCLAIVKRLQFLVELPHSERVKHLYTLPKVSKGDRDWYDSDFADLADINWKDVLPHAYQLYQIQECVRLWGTSSSPSVAIALIQWAIQSSSKLVFFQHAALQQELAYVYGRGVSGAAERFRDMRNLIIAWSTSITDAGVPFPIMDLPPRGGFGDGISGYRGDGRRAIPEIELAVAAAPTIVQHWRKILKARISQRTDIMSLDDETWLSRKMFVVSAQVHHYRQDPRSQILKSQVIQRSTASASPSPSPTPSSPRSATTEITRYKPRFSDKFRVNAENARKDIATFEPLKRARVRPPPVRHSTSSGALVHGHRNTSVPVIMNNPFGQKYFVPPPEEKSIERLIQEPELSSDEDGGYTSDEDANVTVNNKTSRPTYLPATLAQIDANSKSGINVDRPFAFTIGPHGFNRDSSVTPPTPIRALPINTIRPALDSSSDLSNSGVLMSRQSSMESSSGMGSASEAETVVRRPHGKSIAIGALNTPIASIYPSPSPSPNASNTIRQSRPPFNNCTLSQTASYSPSTQSNPSIEREDAHVGLLVREREEYIQFRLPTLEREGIIVPTICENYMWKWIRKQVNSGAVPKVINGDYLKSIGIYGDPHEIDLGPWVQSNSYRWSPLECLLRAGIKPKELPVQHIPHSLIHTKILLRHFDHLPNFADEGELLDKSQADEDLAWLCHEEIGEDANSYLCTKREHSLRRSAYEKEFGLGNDQSIKNKRSTSVRSSIPRDTPLREINEEGEYEGEIEIDSQLLDEEEDEDVPSSPRSDYEMEEESSSRRDISTFKRSLLYTVDSRKDVDGIGGLLKNFGESNKEDDMDNEVNLDFDQMLGIDIRTIGLGSEFGLNDELNEVDREEQDQNIMNRSKKGRKQKKDKEGNVEIGKRKKRKASLIENEDDEADGEERNYSKKSRLPQKG